MHLGREHTKTRISQTFCKLRVRSQSSVVGMRIQNLWRQVVNVDEHLEDGRGRQKKPSEDEMDRFAPRDKWISRS